MRIKECMGIVTGGASGLGEATVRNLVAEGARAAILDIQAGKGAALANELGAAAMFIDADVTQEESVQAAVRTTMDAFGAINVVVNCAGGIVPGRILGKKGVLPLSDFNRVVQLNLIGTINVIRFVAEQMVKNMPNEEGERGVIINTSSLSAFDGLIGQAAYSASKAAVAGMTLPIARELAEYGIRVVTIAPGLFDTPMSETVPEKAVAEVQKVMVFPKRPGKPSEFARMVAHTIENPMLNGVVIRLDGAISAGVQLR
jgi:3-hydroxyacyl-CoA dehydrogenase / 3-hydroxy-2-methylbutyryl-CoA dehydrogenase